MPSTWVFGYGSLVDAGSASTTLGRDAGRILPARLEGWRRRFSQARDNATCEKTFARADDGSVPEWILGLNVERCDDPDQWPNGGLIEVGAADLDRLDVREIRYDRVDVRDSIACAELPAGAEVVTYVAKPGHLAVTPPPGAVILRSYADAVERAFEAFGEHELAEYRRTTLPYPVELVEAVLVRDEIPEGNPREW